MISGEQVSRAGILAPILTALDHAPVKKGNQDSNPGLPTHVQFGEFIFNLSIVMNFGTFLRDIMERKELRLSSGV